MYVVYRICMQYTYAVQYKCGVCIHMNHADMTLVFKGGITHFRIKKKKRGKNGHNFSILPPMKLIYSSKCSSIQELSNDI